MNEYWRKLSIRFLRNECNAKEKRLVRQALRDGFIDDIFLAAIEDVMSSGDASQYADIQDDVPEKILCNLKQMISQPQKNVATVRRRRPVPEWLRIAAAVALAVTMTWMLSKRPQSETALSAMNTVTAPAGQTVNMKLSDGTTVWLNSRTTIKYPGVFGEDSREVWLEGEGFFDVATNREKPFIVHAGKYEVTATGTKFNVEAYSSDSAFSASLLEGKIDVATGDNTQRVSMKPNMIVKEEGGRFKSDTIRNYDHYRWREGLICFKDTYFSDLMKQFEKCYGISIVIENGNAIKYKCTGKFFINDGIEYALRVLQRDVSFKYARETEDKIIYIR